jgi:cytochrome c556
MPHPDVAETAALAGKQKMRMTGRMKTWLAAGLLVALAGGAMAPAVYAQADVIAQRRAGLKRMGESMEALKRLSDARAPATAELARIDDMITWFRGLPPLFPAGSGAGDTKALPAIWSDFAGFQTAAGNMVTQLTALRAAAASGDGAAFNTAFAATGPVCGACHRPFRAR